MGKVGRTFLAVAVSVVGVFLLNGCGGSIVLIGQPQAVLTANPTEGLAPLAVKFDLSGSSDATGTIVGFELQFGDESPPVIGTDITKPIQHAYADDGFYTAVLVVANDRGLTAHAKVHIKVANPGPTASFSCTLQGRTVSCDACGSVDPASLAVRAQTVITYEWDFGDGSQAFSTACMASHTYSSAGPYTVTLRIWDDDGAMSTSSIEVQEAPCEDLLVAWVDENGHIWIENCLLRWDVSHGSSFIVKVGTEPRDWRYYRDEYNYYATMGKGGGVPGPGPGYAATQERRFHNGEIINNPDGSITIHFFDIMVYPEFGLQYPLDTRLTFYKNSGLIKVGYAVGNVSPDPNPPGLVYPLSLTPGGDKANDYYFCNAIAAERPFPYGGGRWFYKEAFTPVNGYVYITDYDKAVRQGLAWIGKFGQTADHISDINYGIVQIADTTYYGNYSHITVSMNATLTEPDYYMLVYETDPDVAYRPVEELINSLP